MLEAHRRSKAEEFGISAEEFAAILDEIAAKNISPTAPVKTQDFLGRFASGFCFSRCSRLINSVLDTVST